MPPPDKPPIARLAGLTLPGTTIPVAAGNLGENLSVLRPDRNGGGWRAVRPSAGMDLHAGDLVYLRGEAFRSLGARAFTLDGNIVTDPGLGPPPPLDLVPHEATHVVQQSRSGRPKVTPVNDAFAEAADRAATDAGEAQAGAIERMILHPGGTGR